MGYFNFTDSMQHKRSSPDTNVSHTAYVGSSVISTPSGVSPSIILVVTQVPIVDLYCLCYQQKPQCYLTTIHLEHLRTVQRLSEHG